MMGCPDVYNCYETILLCECVPEEMPQQIRVSEKETALTVTCRHDFPVRIERGVV